MRKKLKIIIIVTVIMSLMVLQMGCSKEKNLTVVDDILKNDPIVMKDNIQIEEKILDLKLEEGSYFHPSYFEGDKLIGMIIDRDDLSSLKPQKKKSFYEIDKDGNVKESEKKEFFIWDYNGIKGVTEDLYEDSVYYYDFTNGKNERTKITTMQELFPESTTSYDCWRYDVVRENDKYMAVYGYKGKTTKERQTVALKLFDIENKKLYQSDVPQDKVISDILYIKNLKAFVVVDNSGQVYKLNMIEGRLEFNKLVKIPIGDGNRIENKDCLPIINDDDIVITNIVNENQGTNQNKANVLMMTYNLKNGKVSNFIEGDKDEYTRVKQYIPKHNLALISKVDLQDKNKRESLYIAKIKGASINYLHKLKEDIKEGEEILYTNVYINDSGDRMFISQCNTKDSYRDYYERNILYLCKIKQ